MPERDTDSLPTDPPIIVGGGGSTLIWIRKDHHPEAIDPATLPDLPGKPAHPSMYDCYVLRNFECSQVTLHDGGSGHHQHPMKGQKHSTLFE